MTVWITGANGFIGRYLVRELADGGQPIRGLGHGAFAEADRGRLGLKTWLNGEVDAANLNALAAVHGLPYLRKQLLSDVCSRLHKGEAPLIGKSKTVLNGAIDMAGKDRGNMRCFEAIGCGALLLSDEGNYPKGMKTGETLMTYRPGSDCVSRILECLTDWGTAKSMAVRARKTIEGLYGKDCQWSLFTSIVESL